MTEYQEVESYILTNMFYHDKWDELSMLSDEDQPKVKQAVVNNAEAVLLRELPHHFNASKPIPIDVLAEQCLYILEFDDSHRRAEMGVSYFMASGLYLSFDKNFKDRSIAKTILHRYPRRKFGRYVYSRQDNYRKW